MTSQEKIFVRTLAQYIAELDDVRPKIVRNTVDRILRELEADSHE